MNKPRRLKSKTKKYFGEPNEKWARGGGRYGYGGRYGINKYGQSIDNRTKVEKIDVTILKEHIKEINEQTT